MKKAIDIIGINLEMSDLKMSNRKKVHNINYLLRTSRICIEAKEFLIVEEKAVFDFRNWLFIATLAKLRQFLKEFRALLVNKTECEV